MVRLSIAFLAYGLLFQVASAAPLNVERGMYFDTTAIALNLIFAGIALSQRSNISVTTSTVQAEVANNRPTIIYVNEQRCGTGLVDGVLRRKPSILLAFEIYTLTRHFPKSLMVYLTVVIGSAERLFCNTNTISNA